MLIRTCDDLVTAPPPPDFNVDWQLFRNAPSPPTTNTSTLRLGGEGGMGPRHHNTQATTHADQLATFMTSTVYILAFVVTLVNGNVSHVMLSVLMSCYLWADHFTSWPVTFTHVMSASIRSCFATSFFGR